MATSNTDSSAEIDLEAEFESGPNSDFEPNSEDETDSAPEPDSDSEEDSDSTSLTDRLDTATTVVWAAFLAFVVAVALIPVAAVGLGVAPFVSPPVGPYFAFVGLALVGSVAIIAVAIYGG